MKERFSVPADKTPTPDSRVLKVKKTIVKPLDWGEFGDINGEKKIVGNSSPDSGVFKVKKPTVESLDWGDFGDINGEKKVTSNPFGGYRAEASSVERELTPREEEHVWRAVNWKYPRIRGNRPFLLEPGTLIDVKPEDEGPIYTEEEKEKARHLFEKQKRIYLEGKKFRSK